MPHFNRITVRHDRTWNQNYNLKLSWWKNIVASTVSFTPYPEIYQYCYFVSHIQILTGINAALCLGNNERQTWSLRATDLDGKLSQANNSFLIIWDFVKKQFLKRAISCCHSAIFTLELWQQRKWFHHVIHPYGHDVPSTYMYIWSGWQYLSCKAEYVSKSEYPF